MWKIYGELVDSVANDAGTKRGNVAASIVPVFVSGFDISHARRHGGRNADKHDNANTAGNDGLSKPLAIMGG